MYGRIASVLVVIVLGAACVPERPKPQIVAEQKSRVAFADPGFRVARAEFRRIVPVARGSGLTIHAAVYRGPFERDSGPVLAMLLLETQEVAGGWVLEPGSPEKGIESLFGNAPYRRVAGELWQPGRRGSMRYHLYEVQADQGPVSCGLWLTKLHEKALLRGVFCTGGSAPVDAATLQRIERGVTLRGL